jgi:hypothetical protein
MYIYIYYIYIYLLGDKSPAELKKIGDIFFKKMMYIQAEQIYCDALDKMSYESYSEDLKIALLDMCAACQEFL